MSYSEGHKVCPRLRELALTARTREITQPSIKVFLVISAYAQQKCRNRDIVTSVALSLSLLLFSASKTKIYETVDERGETEGKKAAGEREREGERKKIFSRVVAARKVKSEAGSLRRDVAKLTTFRRQRIKNRGRGGQSRY